MTDGVVEVPLPFSVERLIEEICVQKFLPMPDIAARRSLSKIGEKSAIDVLKRISSTSTGIYNFSGFIVYMVNRYGSVASNSSHGEADSIRLSSTYPSSPCSSASSSPARSAIFDSPTSNQFLESSCCCKGANHGIMQHRDPTNGSHGTSGQQSSSLTCSSLKDAIPNYGSYTGHTVPPFMKQHGTSLSASQKFKNPQTPNHLRNTTSYNISQQSLILSELEFRKLFMVYSYIGRNKLEDVVSVEDAKSIKSMRTIPMFDFEDWMWSKFGCHNCQPCDRGMYLDWDCGKTHLYYCYVSSDGVYQFKGPYLDTQKTHLQRAIGDENVLIVKFAAPTDTMTSKCYENVAEGGILIGLRHYCFFVFKDGGKERQKKVKEDRKQASTNGVKCYFIRRESIAPYDERDSCTMKYNTTHDVRCLFMHVHTVSSMTKYIARFSLILSKTIKLQLDLTTVSIEEIDDIPCMDEDGHIVLDDYGEPLIQTDGTGFISEDLAGLVPSSFVQAKFMKDKEFEKFELVQPEIGSEGLSEREVPVTEQPLLIQCRLYNGGTAVKGTLLLNKKLKPRTIQIRQSMIKVQKDPRLSDNTTFNSVEVVCVSHKPPRTAKLSKTLIALLSNGGVSDEYFLGLLEGTMKDSERVSFDPRAAFRIANIYQNIDDSGICMEMFGAKIPLNEPYFQYRLSQLAKEERKGLGEGKIPIDESFYLMGTTDPTGILNSDEVCIILENGQISGKVLVYRNPGIHFGDIHTLTARYVKELEDYIGNSKYAIFFSTKGRRSVANEIAGGDFDGDMYWVSRNPQLLQHFQSSKPWKRSYSTPNVSHKKPIDFSSEELERELLKLLFAADTHSSAAGVAADSWTAFMDQYLTLQHDANKKQIIEKKMLRLVDLYYDALDPKSGKKVVIPHDLRATQFPHYMGRTPEYHSTSVLGIIFDKFNSCKTEKQPVQEIWKLPYFNVSVPGVCLNLWKERYRIYKQEMSNALKFNDQSKNDAAKSVITNYKQMLYGASDFKDCTRDIEQVYNEALAIYHVCYDYARSRKDVVKCGFVWKVAGAALCAYHRKIHCMKTGEREITFVSSSFNDIF